MASGICVVQSPSSVAPSLLSGPSVFLAGGITGARDWQADAIKRITEQLPGRRLTIWNPRRVDFSPENHADQVRWEFNRLREADAILFWFPPETLCPITLYELGSWTQIVCARSLSSSGDERIPDLIIGCDPAYAKRSDVILQTELAGLPHGRVHDSLEDLVDEFVEWYKRTCGAL